MLCRGQIRFVNTFHLIVSSKYVHTVTSLYDAVFGIIKVVYFNFIDVIVFFCLP